MEGTQLERRSQALTVLLEDALSAGHFYVGRKPSEGLAGVVIQDRFMPSHPPIVFRHNLLQRIEFLKPYPTKATEVLRAIVTSMH